MKYVATSDQTEEALKRWAGKWKPFITSFYFWNAGVWMQKSQLGLLQSMLYQILCADPSLVSRICPDHRGSEPWSIMELKEAFR